MRVFLVKKKWLLRGVIVVLVLAIAIICAQTIPAQPVFFGKGTEYQVKSIKTEEKRVAITIDTAFGQTDYTADILAVLKEKDVPVTFAVMGMWAKEHPEQTLAIASADVEVISHSYAHERYDALAPEQAAADARLAQEYLAQMLGVQTGLIRVPYNSCNKVTSQALGEAGFVPIGFAIDAKDVETDAGEIVSRISEEVKPGDIILFQNNNPHAAPAIGELIDRMKSLGYRFETVSQLLGENGYTVNHSGVAVPSESPAKS